MLKVTDLHVSYGNIVALRGVSLEVAEGEIVAVIGPNGAGKSTLLLTIAGVVRAKQGDVRLGDASVLGIAPELLASRGVALVPEGRHIFGSLTVAENIALGATTRRDRQAVAGRHRARARHVPDPARTLPPAGRQAVRRRAADAGDRARPAGAAEAAAARRTLARPGAADRPAGLRRDLRAEAPGHDHPGGRAERAPRGGRRRPHLRHEFRPDRDVRPLVGAARHRCVRRGLFRRRCAGRARDDRHPERDRRHLAGRGLRAGRARHRPHLQHHAADQLRPWRADHGRRLRALRPGRPALSGHGPGRGPGGGDPRPRHGAAGLSAAAQGQSGDAADLVLCRLLPAAACRAD